MITYFLRFWNKKLKISVKQTSYIDSLPDPQSFRSAQTKFTLAKRIYLVYDDRDYSKSYIWIVFINRR